MKSQQRQRFKTESTEAISNFLPDYFVNCEIPVVCQTVITPERAYVLRRHLSINKVLLLATGIDINLKLVWPRSYRFISKANRVCGRTRAYAYVDMHMHTGVCINDQMTSPSFHLLQIPRVAIK